MEEKSVCVAGQAWYGRGGDVGELDGAWAELARMIGRAKRDQSRGWLGFRTGVALHEVYLRKPSFAERGARRARKPEAAAAGVLPYHAKYILCVLP
jgi:hypothetical protein